MAIDTKTLGPIQAYQKLTELQDNKNIQNPNNAPQKMSGEAIAQERVSTNISKMEMRVEQQASLVSHLFGDGEMSLSSSMKITYQSAIYKLNEILMADMGLTNEADGNTVEPSLPGSKPISEEALQSQGGMEYWTPENTAKRIVEGASAFFSGFQTAHPELEGQELMDQFIEVVGGGLTQGFDEARGILGDLNVLEGEIADNIDLTYNLVQTGMQNYQEEFLANLAKSNE